MNHLAEAKKFARSADGVDIDVDWAQVNATLAIAHVLIAREERAELEEERLERWQEYQARRKTETAL